MSQKTLKDLLKPPFKWGENYAIFDSQKKVTGNILFCSFLNGYGDRADTQEEWRLQNEYMDFIVAAMNEKAERDHVEPLRWIVVRTDTGYFDHSICPYCKKIPSPLDTPSYCPNCGRRVDQPEWRKE